MLNSSACYLLGSSPSVSPFATKLLLRLMGDFDLRKPRILNSRDLASLYRGWSRKQIKKALDELEGVGLLEDLGSVRCLLMSEGRLMRLRSEMLLLDSEREEWIKETREMREREESLAPSLLPQP